MVVKFFIIYIIPIIIILLYGHLSKGHLLDRPVNDKRTGIIRFLFPYKDTFINISTYIPLLNYNIMGSVLSDILIFSPIDWVELMVIIFKVRKIFQTQSLHYEPKYTDTLNTYMIEKKNGNIFVLSNFPDGYVEKLCQSFKRANITKITEDDAKILKYFGFKELIIKKTNNGNQYKI
jgi:hypothetical protein